MDLMDSVFATISRIFVQLIVASLVIWLINGGANDWGVLHKISISMALLGLVLSMLMLMFSIVCGVVYLARWVYERGL